ncbi:MAG: Ig-like domain-containing protein [Erysipelotrichaceae bacterium]|nr:Ig-like domain-containing protein [Erysipelotrichaceae bacterium]
MYTEYNSNNVSNVNNFNQANDYDEKPNKFLSVLWKILLVIIILIIGFLLLIKFKVLSFTSSVMPNAIVLNQNEIGIKKGKGYQLVSTVLPENAENKQVVWESSDPKIVSVNSVTGYITGVKEGSATITVKTLINDISTDCIVNVSGKNILVSKIFLNEKRISLAVGYTHSLTYQITPKNATENDLIFTSSDSSVATVNQSGVIQGLKEGNAIITVSSSNGLAKDTTYVSVYKKGASTVVDGEPIKTDNYPKSLTVSPQSLNLKLGGSSQLIASVLPEKSNNQISWSSTNSRVATVDSNGLVSAVGMGSATIIARTINDITYNVNVLVGNYSKELRSILVTTNYISLSVSNSKQLAVAFTPADASNKNVFWTSSNPSVATVDKYGVVKAISPGSTIIKATSEDGGYTDTATIEVVNYDNIIEEKSIAFDSSSYTVGIGSTKSLIPIITPSNATFKSVRFESSNPSIATVDENGVVRGLKEGTVSITATTNRNRLKATTTIIVKYINATSVKVNTTNVNLGKNETFTLVATVLPSDATNKKVSYSVSNSNIATIDANGIITGKNTGTTTITITPSEGNPATVLVNVK